MKHYRLNQIAMAVLGALLLIFGTRTLINIAFEEHEPEKPGMEVAGAKHGEKPGEKPAAPAGSELPALLAKGDAAKGETTAAICKACHALEKDAPSPVGPNLHNVVGRKIASVEGFNYSPALKAHAGETWTYEHLDAMIHKPADFAPGTLMAFPGLPDAQQRADVILFLRTKTDNPPPLPEVVATAPAAAPAGEAAKPAADPNLEVAALVAKADPAKGEGDAAICKACHAFEKGAPSPVGPNLYGVLGRKIASVEGFNYTPAMKAHAEETWDYAHVDRLIHKPAEFAPGTMMAFPGLPDANQRAEVIAFLRTKADSPYPLPEAAAAPAPESAPAPEAPKAEEPAAAPEAPKAEATPAPEAPKAEEPAAAPAPEAPKAEEPAAAPEEPKAEATPAPEAPKAEEPAAAPAPAPEEPKAEAPAEAPAPAAESAPAPAEEPAASPAPEADMSPPSTSTQPQPTYPSGEPE